MNLINGKLPRTFLDDINDDVGKLLKHVKLDHPPNFGAFVDRVANDPVIRTLLRRAENNDPQELLTLSFATNWAFRHGECYAFPDDAFDEQWKEAGVDDLFPETIPAMTFLPPQNIDITTIDGHPMVGVVIVTTPLSRLVDPAEEVMCAADLWKQINGNRTALFITFARVAGTNDLSTNANWMRLTPGGKIGEDVDMAIDYKVSEMLDEYEGVRQKAMKTKKVFENEMRAVVGAVFSPIAWAISALSAIRQTDRYKRETIIQNAQAGKQKKNSKSFITDTRLSSIPKCHLFRDTSKAYQADVIPIT